jgi:hypothetical protein
MLTKTQKKNHKYFCEFCVLKTSNKKDFEKHLTTSKHLRLTNPDSIKLELEKNGNICFMCNECNRTYKSRVGLWKHKKICETIIINETTISNTNSNENMSSQITPELILSVLEQNKELTNLVVEQNKTIMELAKTGQGNNISNNNINSNN